MKPVVRVVGVMVAVSLLSHGSSARAASTQAHFQRSPGPLRSSLTGPSLRYALELDVNTREALSDQKRDEAMAQLEKLLPRFDDSNPDKPDLVFQLAELYFEKYKRLYAVEEAQHEQAYKAYEAEKARGKKVLEPKVDHAPSENLRKQMVHQYEAILNAFPRYPRTDEVLFSLAYSFHELGRPEDARVRYEELIKRFPKSAFVPDAYIQLGDQVFDAGQLVKARSLYEKAYASDLPKIHSYALYKLAWVDFNEGALEACLEKLKAVITFAEEHGQEMVDLKHEALNDLVLVFVKLDKPEEGIAYFEKKASPERQPRLLAKLGYGLQDSGLHEDALRIFRRLLSQDPLRPEAPALQQAIIRSHDKLRQREQVKAEVKHLAERYLPGSAWWRAHEKAPDVLREAFNVSEEGLRTLATDYHQEAQKTKQVETYRLARDLYQQYVDAFASSADPARVSDQAFNLRFYHAEVLWTLEEWEAAALEYDAVVAFQIPERESAKEISNEAYRKSAAYNAILAYNKLLKIERGQLKATSLQDGQKIDEARKKGGVEKGATLHPHSAKASEEQPLSRTESRLVAACDVFTRLFPGEPDELEIRYQVAILFYDKNHWVEAAKRFGEIILKWPEDKHSQQAADLTLYLLDAREEWFELSRLSREFLANPKLAKTGTAFTQRLLGIAEGARYKWIDEVVYKKEKNAAKAAEEFLSFVKESPGSKMADRSLTYAMLMFQELKQLDRGVETGERVLSEYPDSPFGPKVRYTLARMYEQLAEYEKSAQAYEAFVVSFDASERQWLEAQAEGPARQAAPREKAIAGPQTGQGADASPASQGALIEEARAWVPDAQFNAGLWYEALGQLDKAEAAFRQYLVRFKDRRDAPEIAFNLGLMYERSGNWTEASRAFEDFETRYRRDERVSATQHVLALFHQLKAQGTLKKVREGDRLAVEVLKGYAKLSPEEQQVPEVGMAYAHARLLALEPLWRSYVAIRLTRVATLKRDLLTKQKKLEALEKAYGEVLALGVAEPGIAALLRIGMAYSDLAKNIADSPNPRGLSPEQVDLYRGELEKLSLPLEDKAVDALEKGLEKADELSVYTAWTISAQEQLNAFRPGRYPKVPEIRFQDSGFVAFRAREGQGSPRTEGAASDGKTPVDQTKGIEEVAPAAPDQAQDEALLDSLLITYRSTRQYEKAREIGKRLLSRDPGNLLAQKDIALASYEQGKDRLAEILLGNLLKREDPEPGIPNLMGLIQLKRGEPTLALTWFRKAVALDPGFVPGYLNLGALALTHRDYLAAERAFAKVIQLEPTSQDARLYYAYALDGQKGRDPKKAAAAGDAFEQVLALRPEQPEAVCGAGWAYAADRATLDKALFFLEKCKGLREGNASEVQLIELKLKGLAAMKASPGEPSSPAQNLK